MKVIHLLRKPCSEGTVAANVLRWGTGALNIDGCRVATAAGDEVSLHGRKATDNGWDARWSNGQTAGQTFGRWPANVILSCGVDCDGDTHAPGCPVAVLDAQSGVTKSTGGRIGNASGAYTNQGSTGWSGEHRAGDPGYGDKGGASRFFKQVTNDLPDYLRTMICPDHLPDVIYLHINDPDSSPWADHTDASVHGMTVEARSAAGQAAWLPEAYRVLKPGAHLLLAAPDGEPVGDTGACIAEDIGFEVRDCILLVDHAGDRLHYVAKAGKKEREAGVGGANVGARANTHPTVKPIGVMRRLLADVPRAQGPVLDPFVGSGTTLLACVAEGHDGIGIEREDEYFAIALARVEARVNGMSVGLTKVGRVREECAGAGASRPGGTRRR